MQRKNCYIFGSCSRRSCKGKRPKSHSKALRDEIAETSRSCSFPPSPPTPLHPRRGDQGSSTALCGQRFVRGGVHVQTPTFKLAGNQRPGERVDRKRVVSATPCVQDSACFRPVALAVPAQAAINGIAILALQPPLSPPTPLPPRRAGKGGQQPYVAACCKWLSSP